MNKKECINLINELFEKLDDAKRQIFELETELKTEKENSVSKKEVLEPKEQETALEIQEETTETLGQVTEIQEEVQVEETKVEEKKEEKIAPKKPQEEIVLPQIKTSEDFAAVGEDVFYASEILSKILVAAEKYLNMADTKQSVKDLIISQLKTAKQTILSLTLADTEISEKKIYIYNVYNSTLDYFEELIVE